MAHQPSGVNNGKSMADEKVYTTLSSMKSAAATNKSPKKHQKHNSRGTANGHHQNSSGTNRSGSTAAGVNKRDVWPLTSTKQINRAEYSSSEDLATCSKGGWHFYVHNTSKHTFNSVRSLFYLRAIWPVYGFANVRPLYTSLILEIDPLEWRRKLVDSLILYFSIQSFDSMWTHYAHQNTWSVTSMCMSIVFSFLWIYYTFFNWTDGYF